MQRALVVGFGAALLLVGLAGSATSGAEPAKPASAKPAFRGPVPADDQPKLLLWPEGAPGAVGAEDVDRPWVWVYAAPRDKATGAALVICPGGGYGNLALAHEGRAVAEFLNELGISAFVLKYRLAPRYKHPAPLADAQRALRLVRSRAADYGIDPAKVGIWGFSAGGHLASSAATHFKLPTTDSRDAIDALSARPDLAILAYPVITMTELTHGGSKRNLLGEQPDPALVERLSNEKQVTPDNPPTFLFHTGEDTAVLPENSILFYEALRRAKVPAELHIYEHGRHGVGLAGDDPVLGTWPGRLADWLRSKGWAR